VSQTPIQDADVGVLVYKMDPGSSSRRIRSEINSRQKSVVIKE